MQTYIGDYINKMENKKFVVAASVLGALLCTNAISAMKYSKELKKLPAVLFHSFMGSLIEAESLLKRGINGYFSFGKQIFNNNKKVIQLVSELPLEKLLLETDAPFQTLKGEKFTDTKEIEKIYTKVFELRKESEKNFAGFCRQLESNFYDVYSFLR